MNVDHIAHHRLTPRLWEDIFHAATEHDHDKDDSSLWAAEGRHGGQRYRLVYLLLEGSVVLPVLVLPITGFLIHWRGVGRDI